MGKAVKKESKSSAASEYLAKKLRPQQEALKAPTQKMIINVSPVDKEGKKIAEHIGKFHIEGTDLFSDIILFRPLASLNKLIKMSKSKDKEGKEKWNYINETILFTNYSDPIYDAKGTIACGKIFGQARQNLSAAEAKDNNDKAKSFLYIFGLAQFPNSDEWHFVDFRVGGKRIIACSDAFGVKTIGKNHVMSEFIYNFTLKPTSKGVHPDLEIDTNTDETHDVDDILSYDEEINLYVKAHNDRVLALYKKYNSQSQVDDDDDLSGLDIGEDE